MSNFTRDMQRRRREAEPGWVYNTPPIREDVISPPTRGAPVDPVAAMGLALAAVEAAIEEYGPHSDPLGVHLLEARTQIHSALQTLSSP